MFQDTQPLVSSIVDCLGNLNLSQDLVDKTRKVIVKSMAASRFQLSDLPTVVDYLLTSINKKGDSCSELVSDLRDHLELTVKMRASQRPGSGLKLVSVIGHLFIPLIVFPIMFSNNYYHYVILNTNHNQITMAAIMVAV